MRHAGVLAILAVVLASASLVQGGGWNQNAHLALVRALAHGTAQVDEYRSGTGDLAQHDGRLYSAKAPGLALIAVGPYTILDRSGALAKAASVTGIERDDVDLWLISTLVCVIAFGLILVLVMRLGNDVARGYGALAAVTAGAGTLLLPFSTLVFAHVPAAALSFAAFATLWLRRGRVSAFAAGCLAGLAVTVEYPLAIAALGFGLYALALGDALWRGVAYGAGVVAGALPLFLYNAWVFGSPLHFPYEDALPIAGEGANDKGLFGISWPSIDTAAHLLFGSRGLVVISPVVLCGLAALLPLYRRGRRKEAVLIAGLALAFVAYNAGYDVPFGGDSPGPRFLIAVLPFLAVPLALSYSLWPLVTGVVATASVVYGVGVTVTGPLQASGWSWVSDGSGATKGELARFLLLVTAAVVLAVLSIPRTRRGAGTRAAP